jgi:phosphatidylserine/phosphatidylglycerophosphate/cardiolipin synthase-like enzyme
MPAASHRSPDWLIASVGERRPAILDVIRQARRRLTLSLFRCNDASILDELKAAVDRGVEVEVLVTSRAKGGRKKLEQLWDALEQTGAMVHPSPTRS